jgi:hypothetical protein
MKMTKANSTSFAIIVRKGPYNEQTTPTDWIGETPLQSFDEVVCEVAGGQVDADDIEKIILIDLANGTANDITAEVAEQVWCEFDCNNVYAWKELKAWLEGFGHDCEHLTGETQDIRHFYGL